MAEQSDALERMWESQRAALGLMTEALTSLGDVARAGPARPDEAIRQFQSVVSTFGELVASGAQPMEEFIESQRKLAAALASSATLARELAGVLDAAATNHAAGVDALEAFTMPIRGFAGTMRQGTQTRTEPAADSR